MLLSVNSSDDYSGKPIHLSKPIYSNTSVHSCAMFLLFFRSIYCAHSKRMCLSLLGSLQYFTVNVFWRFLTLAVQQQAKYKLCAQWRFRPSRSVTWDVLQDLTKNLHIFWGPPKETSGRVDRCKGLAEQSSLDESCRRVLFVFCRKAPSLSIFFRKDSYFFSTFF